MPRKNMKKALGASLKAEEQAVRSRFEKAETALAGKGRVASVSRPSADRRVIRDSFTMPAPDYELISSIKKRCLKLGTAASKSEVLRAGLVALDALSDRELQSLFEKLPKVKTGRPKP
jgi:hypothetical protein